MKIQIEILNFAESCSRRTILANKLKFEECEVVVNHPTIVLVVGKGVISKSYANDENIIQRVKGNDSLYWSCDDESKIISFVRKEQIDSEIEDFISVISIEVVHAIDDEIIKKVTYRFYNDVFTIGNIVKYDDASRKIVSHLIKRVEIPFMISIFVILLINFFVNSHFSEANSKLQLELVNSRRIAKNMESQRSNESKLLSENLPVRDLEVAVMLDKLSSQMPSGITLNNLTIDPLKRRLEEKKAPNIDKNIIMINGETTSANDITIMTNRIEKLDFAKSVKIKNIAQNRDDDKLEFEVEVIY